MTQEKKENAPNNSNNGALATTKSIADDIKTNLSVAGAAAKSVGVSLPGPVGKIGKAANIVSAAISEQGPGWVEKAVCGGARVVAQSAASTPLTAAAIAQSIAMNPFPHPLINIGIGISTYRETAPIIDKATKPIGDAAGAFCHRAFDFFKSPAPCPKPLTISEQNQKDRANKYLVECYIRNQSINGFQPYATTPPSLARYNAYNTPNRPFYHPPAAFYAPFHVKAEINNYLLQSGNSSNLSNKKMMEQRANLACLFLQYQTCLGYSQMYGLSSFHSALAMTGLISSYNNYNLGSMVQEAIHSTGSIGGVAGDVSLMTDLIDSEAHAKASSYFFCFPTQSVPFPSSSIKQIAHELKTAYFTHKTLPFFSLHFNNQGFMYPVNHTAYTNTLTGVITAFLDYWMKCFLNGGIFNEEFLNHWHESYNCDEQSLREQLIDLKHYYKANEGRYISLRELESRYGLNHKPHNEHSDYNQPFMTSFRIISSQDHIKREGNILILAPTFRVEYSIDLMPDYKEYLETYHKEHGEYPKDYEQTRLCYELFAQEIKEKMPQMPICRDYFQLLGVINSFCYAYATLEKMGKVPAIDETTPTKSHFIPKAFPPIPIREYHTYPIQTLFGDIFTLLIANTHHAKDFDVEVLALFSNRQKRDLSKNLSQKLQDIIIQIIQSELAKTVQPQQNFEMNDEEVERISRKTNQFLLRQIHQTRSTMNRLIQFALEPLPQLEKKSILILPLPEKIKAAQLLLDKQFNEINSRWNTAKELRIDEILMQFPKGMHKQLREIFADLDEQLKKELNEIIYLYKKAAGILKPEDKLDEAQRSIPQEDIKNIEDEMKSIELEITKLIDAESIELNNTLSELSKVKEHLQDQVNQGNQAINTQQQHKTNQVNSVPAYLYSLNAAAINTFCANVDQQIANIQIQINHFNEKIDLVNKDIAQIQNALSSAPNRKTQSIANIKEQYVRDKIAQFTDNDASTKLEAYKKVALHKLTQAHEQNTKFMQQMDHQIHHFSECLNGIPQIKQHILSNKYTHTTIGFTSQEHVQNSNQKFKIVGGTGMDLPNIQTKPIAHAEDFSECLAKTIITQTIANQPFDFVFNDQHYVVFELPVSDTAQAKIENTSDDIAQLINPNADITALMDTLGNDRLDPSGGHLIHYAATVLDAQSLSKISPELWQKSDFLGNLPLHYAAQSGNKSAIKEILKHFPNQIEHKNNNGLTPLFLAVQHNKMEATQELIAHNANVNTTLPNGLFPLFTALQNNFHEMALWLIRHSPNLILDQEIDSKMTALHLSLDAKNVPVTTTLIEKGANCTIKRKSDGFTAVHCAAKYGMISALTAMNNKGVPLNQTLESGKSALHIAAEENQLEAIDFLRNTGAEVQSKTLDGETPLMRAIKAGHLEAALKLAEYSAINTVNNQHQTASLLAVQWGMAQVADILIERGENPELLDKQGRNYVYYLIRNGEESRFSALLADKKINPNQEFHGEKTIELAAKYGQFLIVYDLLDQGVTYRNKANYRSLLEYALISDEIGFVKDHSTETKLTKLELAKRAAQHGSITCLSWILQQLRPNELHDPGLLKASLESHQNKAIELVLKRQNNINQPLDSKGNTALHLSTAYGAKKSIELLIHYGAEVSLRNHANQTVFHIALQQEDKSLLKKLFKLTQPKEWPLDLWAGPAFKPEHILYETLVQFKKKLHNQVLPDTAKQERMNSPLPGLNITSELKSALTQLKNFFMDEEFDEACELLIEQPHLIKLFHSEQGADLLQILFANIHDYSKTVAALSGVPEFEDELVFSSPHKLLNHLKQTGINPTNLTGKHNVLLSMLHAETDEEACHRLRLLNQYFPESLSSLALDKEDRPFKIVELALKLNKKQLFSTLDELCANPLESENKTFNSLHEAVIASNYDLVASLLKRYPADSLNNKRQTALMIAAELNHVRIMELLLDHGANPDCFDTYGQNALHHAVMTGSEEAALTILPFIRHKNVPNRSGLTPLILASRQGLSSVIRFLCEESDYSNSFDHKGFNALHHAALKGQCKAIEQLLSYGFDINAVENPSNPKKIEHNLKRSPLHLAALSGHIDAVITLLSRGANADQEDARQYSVFEYAVLSNKNNQIEVLQQLEGYQQKKRDTPLLLAAAKADNIEILSQLILSEVNLNGTDTSGLTALHMAAISNSIQFAHLLLAGKGIAVDAVDQNAMTALHYAANFGHVGLIEALVNAGAKINYCNKNQPTALFLACSNGCTGAVSALLHNKADFTISNAEGITPAQTALINGHIDIARMLHIFGDTSLNHNVIATLPEAAQEKLDLHYSLFQQSIAKPEIKIGNLLINHGIYRQKSTQSQSISNLNLAL